MTRGKDLKPRSSTLTAQAAFRERLARFAVVLLEPQWRGATARYACRCPAGHLCSVSPHKLSQGRRPCPECPTDAALRAERKFREAVARAGGTVSGRYVNTRTPVEVTCSAGHKNMPHPTGVIQGNGFCLTCAGKSPAVAEQRFRELVAMHGGTFVGPWIRSSEGVHCVCPAGHDCYPQLSSLTKGQGLCRHCGGPTPEAAEAEFRRRLADAGADLLEGSYLGSLARHRIICPRNHVTSVRPVVVRRSGVYCDRCPDPRSMASERAFIIALAKHGATYVGPWAGCDKPTALICAAGHHVTAYPTNLSRGNGPCRICAGKAWDALYVALNPGAGLVKFGITSGNPAARLANHRAQGYTEVVRLVAGLSGVVALDAENAIKAALADAGEQPVQGREYFPLHCLALILDVADSWLSTPAAPAVKIPRDWVQDMLFAA